MTPQKQLAMAFKIASEAHLNQQDKSGAPYILHLTKVMHYTKSDDYVIKTIAILHDLLEDCPQWSPTRLLEAGFSSRVVGAVCLLTKYKSQTVEQYLQVVGSDLDATIVKLADLRHNSDIRRLKGLRQKDLERIEKYHHMHVYLTKRKKELQKDCSY